MVTEPAPMEAADELFDPEVPVFMCFFLLANPKRGLSCACNSATVPEAKCYSRDGPCVHRTAIAQSSKAPKIALPATPAGKLDHDGLRHTAAIQG
jgi:hypothetical protein